MPQSNSNLPILYSLQHCPYAMRARLGILLAQQSVLIRAVVTKKKPAEMLAVSPKGTVPVLVIDHSAAAVENCDATIIDESVDIMLWALKLSDPENLLQGEDSSELEAMLALIRRNDKEFKPNLEVYKLAKRFHKKSEVADRQRCEEFVAELESRLENANYLMGDQASLADYALLPFIRQFARVDRKWYLQSPYPKLRDWLNRHLQAPLFTKAMAKYPLWLDCHETFLLGEN
ncbi:glutathione S-transferase [Halieaceae bacterium IMCC14734]|uniref:Glutathione S-transferase n=1 Tax=Candidatus Litorirhabdus singularis TaxID=2518993 RepID=A0ABT3TEN5_9GAMM|nr:glutathione S-transferase [Candidatus Litorirhabdus singularis]MCX2980709.1 glutathione S-transferase [Candidatus Litorirhabdus singularis]